MKKIWDWAFPYVFSLGGHLVLLGLLFLSFSRESRPAHKGVADGGAMVEATLVNALPQSTAAPAEPKPVQPPPATPQLRQPLASPAPAPEPDTATQNDKPIPPQKTAAQPEPQESDAQRDPVHDHPAAQTSPPDKGNPQGLAQPEPADATDPYAQMRRQRSEAERQYQLESESLKWPNSLHAQNAQAAQTAKPTAIAAPKTPIVGNAGADQRNSDLFATPNQSNGEDDWTRFDLPPSTHCPLAGFQPGNDDGKTEDWIDCLLNSTWQDSVDLGKPLLDNH